jgi:AcrR family transcriptional regulator
MGLEYFSVGNEAEMLYDTVNLAEVTHPKTSDRASVEGSPAPMGAKERVLNAAYELFAQHGIGAVGIDTIIAKAGVAKMSLYRHFKSKEELVLAFLVMRENLWTHEWLETEMLATAETPTARLLAIFDIFDRWFQTPKFEGCSFINVLLETEPNSPIHIAAAAHLAHIRSIIKGQAIQAGLAEPDRFAHTWHFLMKGSIVTANEGNRNAAKQAQAAAAILLDAWPRVAVPSS